MATNSNSTRAKANTTTTRKRNTKATNKGKNPSRKKRNETDAITNNMFHDEIELIGSFVISILLILSNFNLCGSVGNLIHQVTFGIFGVLAYLFPFLLFIGIAFHISNRGNKIARRKLISMISLYIVLTSFLQLLYDKHSANSKIIDFYKTSSEYKNGGGILGGILCKIFVPLFGVLGTYVILVAIMFILVMFITEKALFASIGKRGERTLKNLKEKRTTYLEHRNDSYVEEEDIEDSDSSDIAVTTAMEKRKPKVFTLKKQPEDISEQTNANKKSKHLFHKNENHHKNKKEVDTEMEEIIPFDIENIPIHRATNQTNANVFDMKNMPIYEEELRKKFASSSKDYDIKQLANEARNDNQYENEKNPFLDHQRMDNQNEYTAVHKMNNFTNSDSSGNMSDSLEPSFNHNDVSNNLYKDSKQEAHGSVNDDTIHVVNPLEFNFDNGNMDDSNKGILNHDNLDSDDPYHDGNTIDNSSHSDFSQELSSNTKEQHKNQEQNRDNLISEVKKQVERNEVSNSDLHDDFPSNPVKPVIKEYKFPPISLLTKPKGDVKGMTDRELKETAHKLQKTLDSFGVKVTITNVSCGPAVTRYELQPEQGVKVSKITNLADDIKLNLAAADIRIEAPIPGKAAVGIEVPNKENSAVMFRELIESPEFKKHSSNISFAVGKDIGGQTIVTDIAKMPHLLIAGATGSGKSVCINTIIMSILYKANPNDVRLIMVDPKVVELSVYNGIPHLMIPVVTDPKKASAALNWAVMEMTDRYNKFAELGVRDIKGYNEKIASVEYLQDEKYQKMPQIVIIVDELADLMMVAPGEVEDAICRLAQMARAAGLHLIIATQRPSVNVITGLIKANVPSRIAFAVSSAIDSRTIIDGSGAEKLLGKGDMLFFPSGFPKPVRIQGAFVSDKEVSSVVDYLKEQNSNPDYNSDIANQITNVQASASNANNSANDRDEYFIEAGKFIIDKDKASIGMLQRVFKIGFNRAARIMDQLSEAGVVGPEEGTKPRKVLMSIEEFEQYVEEYV